MLQLLKESVTSKYAERLEQIVIALIAIEIGVLFSLFWTSNINLAANSSGNHNYSRRLDGSWINILDFVFILRLEHALILRCRLTGQLTVSHGAFTVAPSTTLKIAVLSIFTISRLDTSAKDDGRYEPRPISLYIRFFSFGPLL